MKVPGPTNFPEGQRAIALWLLRISGIFYAVGTIGVILLLWLGGWSDRSEHDRLLYVAIIGISYALGSIAVTLSFAVGGTVGRFDIEATRTGFKAGVQDRDDPPPSPTVTTTTQVKP